jgi:hypothetical protein
MKMIQAFCEGIQAETRMDTMELSVVRQKLDGKSQLRLVG